MATTTATTYAIVLNGARVIAPLFPSFEAASREAGHVGSPAVIIRTGEAEVVRLMALAAAAYAEPSQHFYTGDEYIAAAWLAS